MTTATLDRPITKADRCDACGARAYVRATLAAGDLHFCNHHWARHGEAVQTKAHDVYTEPMDA